MSVLSMEPTNKKTTRKGCFLNISTFNLTSESINHLYLIIFKVFNQLSNFYCLTIAYIYHLFSIFVFFMAMATFVILMCHKNMHFTLKALTMK